VEKDKNFKEPNISKEDIKLIVNAIDEKIDEIEKRN
jgi:hypothetical protein